MSAAQIKDTLSTSLIEFRMAILYFALFSVNAFCSALMIALANVTWSTLDGQGKFMIYVALIWNWTNTVLAFMSKQATRLKQTGEIFPSGDTQQFIRTETQSVKIEKP
jgi:hypothetical protein